MAAEAVEKTESGGVLVEHAGRVVSRAGAGLFRGYLALHDGSVTKTLCFKTESVSHSTHELLVCVSFSLCCDDCPAMSDPVNTAPARPTAKSISLNLLRQWHWVSSALCLVGMILFAVTGITLNNAAHIPAEPVVTTVETELSPGLLSLMEDRDEGPLPLAVREWLRQNHDLDIPASDAEWDGSEVYLGLPRPGGDAWLSIDLEYGELMYERTDRGTVSFLNDLHKGRNTGTAWSWFLDVFSITCLVFSLSGMWLLVRYARTRPGTWPMVTLGVVIPLLVIVLSIH